MNLEPSVSAAGLIARADPDLMAGSHELRATSKPAAAPVRLRPDGCG